MTRIATAADKEKDLDDHFLASRLARVKSVNRISILFQTWGGSQRV